MGVTTWRLQKSTVGRTSVNKDSLLNRHYKPTCLDTHIHTKSSGKMSKGTGNGVANGPVGLGKSFQKSPGETQERAGDFLGDDCGELSGEGGANSRDWGIDGNQPSEEGTSVSHSPSLWY